MAEKPLLLIVDDDPIIQDALQGCFEAEYRVVGALNAQDAQSALQQMPAPPAAALVDLGLPPQPHRPTEGFAVISALRAAAPACAIVVVSGQDARRHAQRARALGAADYAEKPCAPEELKNILRRARRAAQVGGRQYGLIGDSPQMRMLREQIRLIAPVSYPALVVGESGVGKENVARALHAEGRGGRPFLAINCAAIPPHLLEATLFGNAKGAFTGASIDSPGYLGETEDGTLLLDEVGDLPAAAQAKLLRALETGEYRRVGETRPRQCAARVVAASNHRQLRQSEGGRLRDDLYYRLGAFTIFAPPLRDLGDDRLLLLEHFVAAAAADLSSPPVALNDEARALWMRYRFPGNVRELKNIVARMQVKYGGQTATADMLRAELCDDEAAQNAGEEAPPNAAPAAAVAARLGRQAAARALAKANGNVEAAAAGLGVSADELRLVVAN